MHKDFRKSYPVAFIIMVFLLCFMIPIGCSMFFNYQGAAGYIAPAILLLLTWWLYHKEGKTLGALGITTKPYHWLHLPIGILIGVIFYTIFMLLQMKQNGFHIRFNPNANYLIVFSGFLFLLQGVLNEELIFRGYALQKTMGHMGFVKATIIFAFLFIVWHWIAMNAWNNMEWMLALGITGLGHWLFATALKRSGTLFFPIGIHLGNNWATKYLFASEMGGTSNSAPNNETLFYISDVVANSSTSASFINYIISIACFLISIWLIGKWKPISELFKRN